MSRSIAKFRLSEIHFELPVKSTEAFDLGVDVSVLWIRETSRAVFSHELFDEVFEKFDFVWVAILHGQWKKKWSGSDRIVLSSGCCSLTNAL
jgi:hypothetical protein